MDREGIDDILRTTLEDLRLSRGEKRALGEVLADLRPGGEEMGYLCSRAFELARGHVSGRENLLVLEWIEQVAKVIRSSACSAGREARADVYFTPNRQCPEKIAELFDRTRAKADVCVFTITDARIARAILDAHRRGIAVRIITDDEKATDRGSAIARFLGAGIAVRTDRAESHMHNKFAVFDDELLLTRSYNWTHGAAASNQENFLVTDEPRLVRPFLGTFEALWRQFAP